MNRTRHSHSTDIQRPPAGQIKRRLALLRGGAVLAAAVAAFGLPSPAGATGSGSVADLALTATTSAAGATGITYAVSFVAAGQLTAGTDTASLQAPPGVIFPAQAVCAEYQVTDLTTGADAGCGPLRSGSGTNSVVLNVPNVAAGDQVRVAVNDITNPAGPQSGTLSVSTSANPTPATVADNVSPATAIQHLSVTRTSTEAGATAVGYRVSFVSTSGLTQVDFGLPMSKLTLQASAGVVFPADSVCAEYQVTDLTSGATDPCAPSVTGTGTNQVTISTPDVGPGDLVSVSVNGIANPATTGTGTLAVSTTSDPVVVSQAAPTTAPKKLSGGILTTPAAGAGQVNLQFGFVSPSGMTSVDYGLAMSTITLAAPAGDVFPAVTSCNEYQVIDLTSGANAGCNPLVSGAGSNQVTVMPPNVSPGDQLVVSVNGVAGASSGQHVTAWSTSDPKAAGPYTPSTSTTSVAPVAFTRSSSAAGATNVVYELRFTATQTVTSAYTIMLQAPAGTVFPVSDFGSRYTISDLSTGQSGGYGINNYGVTNVASNEVVISDTVSYEAPGPNINIGDQMVLTVSSIKNPTAAASGTLTMWTSFASTHIVMPDTTKAASAVSGPILLTSSSAAGATGVTDQLRFTLKQPLTGPYSITLTAPAGTVFAPSDNSHQNDYTIENLTTGQSAGQGLNWFVVSGAGTNQVVISDTIPYASPAPSLEAGDQLVLTVNNVENPTAAHAGMLTVSTSSDPKNVSVGDSTTAATAVGSPVLTSSSTVPGATGVSDSVRFTARHAGTNYTITLTAPAGTVFPAADNSHQNNYIIENLTTGQSAGHGLNWFVVSGAGTNQVVISDAIPYEPSGPFFNPGEQVLVQVNNVTNPTTPGSATIATSADPVPTSLGALVA